MEETQGTGNGKVGYHLRSRKQLTEDTAWPRVGKYNCRLYDATLIRRSRNTSSSFLLVLIPAAFSLCPATVMYRVHLSIRVILRAKKKSMELLLLCSPSHAAPVLCPLFSVRLSVCCYLCIPIIVHVQAHPHMTHAPTHARPLTHLHALTQLHAHSFTKALLL